MITARPPKTWKLAFIVLIAALVVPRTTWAASGNVQVCQQGSACEVGEFLYDDSYAPIAGASCTLMSRYPNGSIFVNSQPMASASDGWYSYNVQATGSAGIYRSNVCCTSGSDYLCLDKTFEVATASSTLTKDDVAVAVWGYSSRTLSGFGTLIADIWSYSTRSLTTFGTLAADVWTSATRTLTGNQLNDGKELATVDDIKVGTQSAVISLKGSANKDLSNLSTEIAATQTTVNNIYTDTQAVRTDATSILDKWGTLSAADIYGKVSTISATLGNANDSSSNSSLFGKLADLSESSGGDLLQDTYDQAAAAASTINLVRTELAYNGKSTTAYEDMQRVIGYVDTLETLVGSSSDASSATTLFGRMKKIQDKVDLLTGIQTDVDSVLDKWGSLKLSDVHDKVKDLKDQLLTVSGTTTYSTLVSNTITNNTTIVELKNELITMKAVAQANQVLLEQTVNKPIIKTFMLEGSVIFISLIINPSNVATQTVPFEYYLPQEVEKDDILELDEELSVAYNSEKNQYYVTGEFVLEPSETKTVSIRVEDVWKISETEVASLRKQADELYKPLVNTSYFGQAVTIKSDVDVSLDKISQMQESATTPEKKLRVYKDAQIELTAVKAKIEKLKELVSLASSAGSLVGFVGGAQAIAVWGLIIIMVAGFVFLALYMKTLNMREAAIVRDSIKTKKDSKDRKEEPKPIHHGTRLHRVVRFALLLASFGIVSAISSGVVVYTLTSSRANESEKKEIVKEDKGKVLGEEKVVQKEEKTSTLIPEEKRALIVVPKGEEVLLYKYSVSDSEVVTKIKESQEVKVLDETTNWIKVNLNLSEGNDSVYTTGWVEKTFVFSQDEKLGEVKKVKSMVIIKDTPTGFLRVRETPGGVEIGKVTPGDVYLFLDEDNGWIKIELEDKTFGWVAKRYVEIDNKTAFVSSR